MQKSALNKRKRQLHAIDGIVTTVLLLIFTAGLAYGAVAAYTRSEKRLSDLTHVTGRIIGERYTKEWVDGGRYQYQGHYVPILALSIQGCPDSFGFREKYEEFSRLETLRFADNNTIADIYYDKSGERMKGNIALDVFELRIGDETYINIQDAQSGNQSTSLILLVSALLSGCVTVVAIRKLVKNNV